MRLTALRLLLFVLVTVGVGGMHTIGHPSHGHGVQPRAAVHLIEGHGASGEAMAGGVELPPSHPGDGFDALAVCLAILTAAGLAVLIAATQRRIVPSARAGGPALAVMAILGRAPPPPGRGLVLAGLSVLRI